MRESIEITGASENNLKHLNISIPKEKLVAVSYTHLVLLRKLKSGDIGMFVVSVERKLKMGFTTLIIMMGKIMMI